MDPITLAAFALPVTVLLYGHLALLALRSRRRRHADAERHRADRAHYDTLVLDPYYAAEFRSDEIGAAAARLLLDGLMSIDGRGVVRLDGAGLDPHHRVGHPVPDALLDALRREGGPVTLGRIHHLDTVYGEARDEFRREYHARLPHPPDVPRRWGDGVTAAVLGCAGIAVVVAQWSFCGIALTETDPTGTGQVVAAAAVFLALVAQLGWMGRVPALRRREQEWAEKRPNRWEALRERCAAAPPHPALAALDAEIERRLRVSHDHRGTWDELPEEGEPEGADEDGPDADTEDGPDDAPRPGHRTEPDGVER
ncbi:hypothetical protein [Streptomyces sp. NPDC007883]|uniref:hypothetical protein n=1 Tax=Streptomyces sp. NPDC007883 TaxID=3155116 RepID=UPI0033E47696